MEISFVLFELFSLSLELQLANAYSQSVDGYTVKSVMLTLNGCFRKSVRSLEM